MDGQKYAARRQAFPMGSRSVQGIPFEKTNLIIAERSDGSVRAGYLGDALEDVIGAYPGRQLLNPATVTDGKYLQSNGDPSTTYTAGVSISDYIPVIPGKMILSKNLGGTGYIQFYSDANGTKVAGTTASITVLRTAYTVPAGCYFLRVTCTNSTLADARIEYSREGKTGSTGWTGIPTRTYSEPLLLGRTARSHMGDVRAYGAIGNGLADDTAAFAAAIADININTIYVPDGIYYLAGISIPAASRIKRIVGESKNGTILVLADSPTTPMITIESGLSAFSITNLTLKHTVGFTTSNGITGTDGVLLYLAGSNYDILVKDVKFSEFSNCAFRMNGGIDPRNVVITGCDFRCSTATVPAIYVHGAAEYLNIFGNQFHKCAGAYRGTFTNAANQTKNNNISNNICIECGNETYPVIYSEASRTKIVDNVINHTRGDAIHIKAVTAQVSGILIANNILEAVHNSVTPVAGSVAIRIQGAIDSVIANNRVSLHASVPSLTVGATGSYASQDCVITGNVLRGGAASAAGTGLVITGNIGLTA